MSRINKTSLVEALAHQAATHPTTIVGSAIDVSLARRATVFLYHGYVEATADTNSGSFYIQMRPEAADSTVTEHWLTHTTKTCGTTTPDTEACAATEPVAETVMAVASTTGFAVGDKLYIQNATLAHSEWGLLRKFTADTSITLTDGLTNAQTQTTSIIWNDANVWIVEIDVTAASALRVVFHHEGATGANGHVKAFVVLHEGDRD
jgi:hypothetical protein